MNDQFFKSNVYMTYRSVCWLIGFFGPIIPFTVYVQHKAFWPNAFIGCLTILGLVLLVITYQVYDYYSIAHDEFIVRKVLLQTKIPISQITALSYERRPAWIYLVIKYLDKPGSPKQKESSIDGYDTKTLTEMNEALKQHNPSIEITIDKGAQKFLDIKKNLHLKNPTTAKQRILVILKWLVISATIMTGFLFLAVPR